MGLTGMLGLVLKSVETLAYYTHLFLRLAVEFLETSRVLIPAKTGLAEASRGYTALPSSNELRECLKQIQSTFAVLNNVVNRYLENERKSKWTKGFRMLFTENEIDRLRLSLIQCRESLSARPELKTVSD